MRNTLRALALTAALMPGLTPAIAQQFPTVPANSVIGRLGIGSGPSQAIPFANFLPALIGAQTANTVYAGPTSGAVASAAFRLLVGADLPVPSSSTLGGVKSLTCATHAWMNQISIAGQPVCVQPNYTDLAGTLPVPGVSTLGGVNSKAAVTHNFLTAIGTDGSVSQAQPACADVSNATSYCSAAVGQLPGTTTNDSASGGNVGEYSESIIVVGSAVSLVTATDKTVTSLSLTAGDWDVDCTINFRSAASTSVTVLNASLSLVTNVSDATAGRFTAMRMAAVVPGAADLSLNVAPYRFSLSGTTSIFMVATSVFSVSTETAWGIIRARRVR